MKSMSGPATTASPVVTSPDQVRNVALVGPSGSGKSRLYSHLAREVLAPGFEQERSTSLRATTIALDPGLALTLLDTPGHPDFIGEVRAALRAADGAIFVVSAADGVDAATRALWHECALVQMPRAVAIVQLDANDADYARTLAECQATFGQGVQPLGIPVAGDSGALTQIVDLVLGEVHDYTSGTRQVRPTGEEHADLFDTYRPGLIEGIIEESEDDTLMERYIGGEEIGFDIIEHDLLTAVSHGTFHPVLPVSAETGSGVAVLRHLLAAAFPNPTQRPVPTVTSVDGADLVDVSIDPDGPLVAEVVHTRSDAYVGHVSLVRVFSGTLTRDNPLHISGHLDRLRPDASEGHAGHDDEERAGALGVPTLEGFDDRPQAIAGEIAVVTKLGSAQTSDTISSVDQPLLIEPWELPEALLPVALEPVSRGDEDKLPTAFRELAAEDPSLRLAFSPETGQIVLWSTGPAQQDLVLERLKERFNLEVKTAPVKVALRETFVAKAQAQGRHVKQSGGHGQFAVCHLTVEPLERGAGIEFHETVVGGAVPRTYIPSVEKGARAQLDKGLLAGWPVVDVKVTLTDGKAHSVDSSDMAFQTAAGIALREMASTKSVSLLEPVDKVTVTIDTDYLGAAMTDLSTRRGQILGTDTDPDDSSRSVLTALVPQLELLDYPIALRSFAHGTGDLSRELVGYEPLPARLVAEHLADKE